MIGPDLSSEIGALADLDLSALRQRWLELYGSAAPARMSRQLLVQAIAYRLQEKAIGGLPRALRMRLDNGGIYNGGTAKGNRARLSVQRRIKPGTQFLREWQSRTHKVSATEDGRFLYRGKVYRSLSIIARTITGTRWSGPAFFGLNQNKEPRRHGQVAKRGSKNAPIAVDASRRRFRCAIYTRKSSDEGLEQSFNSLHAQRDACEAYIASQKHEGWLLSPKAYDDGGRSGGSMERPALEKLLEDIQSGLIDIVVVYKVDRLTRSLANFAKLTELFDAHGTSFVSVTQQFNTSTSMGRLTLNVLLSFAQFEREVAGERIRDKIALSKRRGMWMGGLPPLGYDGKLISNEAEAKTVRLIYDHYLKVGSVAELKRWLDRRGIISKRRSFKDGKNAGGVPISRGALYQILRNRLYRGQIAYRGEVHKGNHVAIIKPELWDAVQARLVRQSAKPRQTGSVASEAARSNGSTLAAPLTNLVFDTNGHRLTPTYAVKAGRRYRYYVSAPLVRGERACDGLRVPAADLERLVAKRIANHLRDPAWLTSHLAPSLDAGTASCLLSAGKNLADRISGSPATKGFEAEPVDYDLLQSLIARIVVNKQKITIELDPSRLVFAINEIAPDIDLPETTEPPVIEVAAHTLRCGKQIRLVIGEIESSKARLDPDLIKLIRDAHRWFENLRSGRISSIAAIARRENLHVPDVSRSISLAFLAPDLVEMILSGHQPAMLTIEKVKACRPLPPDWQEQRDLLIG